MSGGVYPTRDREAASLPPAEARENAEIRRRHELALSGRIQRTLLLGSAPEPAPGGRLGQVFASVKGAPQRKAGRSVVVCPSCGAPREVAAETRCAYCDAPYFPESR